MKRLINGQTYNTDTATLVAKYDYQDDKDYEVEAKLYLTRGGAFFIVHQWNTGAEWKNLFEAVTHDEVTRLVEKTDNLEVIDEVALGEPPEAQAEAEPGATLYIRMPAALKRRVDEAAQNENLSANAWAMRCIESCLAGPTYPRRQIDTSWVV